MDDQKCPTANYSITAVQGNREKRRRKIHKLNAICSYVQTRYKSFGQYIKIFKLNYYFNGNNDALEALIMINGVPISKGC